jgi:hypothetical protein
MGGSGSSDFPSSAAEILAAAKRAAQRVAAGPELTIIAFRREDADRLEALFATLSPELQKKVTLRDNRGGAITESEIKPAALLAIFAGADGDDQFLNKAAETALTCRKLCICIAARSGDIVPSKARAYRFHVYDWRGFVEIISA